jgi:hypothetical protein
MARKKVDDQTTINNAFAFLLVSALFFGVALVIALNI